MFLIDKYAYTNRLKDYNPHTKALIACGCIIIPRLINNYYLNISTTILMIALTIIVGGIPWKSYFKMLLAPMSFLIIGLITVVITFNNENYIFFLQLKNTTIGVTDLSLAKGMDLFTTVMASLTSVYFLILTTPINDIIKICKRIRIPALIIELMVLIYRSIFIFLEESNNIYLAQKMKFGYDTRKNYIRSISLLISNLFIKVFQRHKEMNISLECKLYDGEFKLGD